MDTVEEFGVQTSNGTVRLCATEEDALTLLGRSRAWGCTPAWTLVKREHQITEWSRIQS